MINATFWALMALIIFLSLLFYLAVPAVLTSALDRRAEGIAKEIEGARALREEAQQILAEYQHKRRDSEQEIEQLIAAAKRKADVVLAEAKANAEEYVARRTALAEQKIAQAERDALNEIRVRTVDVAIAAASRIWAERMDSKLCGVLFEETLREMGSKLNLNCDSPLLKA